MNCPKHGKDYLLSKEEEGKLVVKCGLCGYKPRTIARVDQLWETRSSGETHSHLRYNTIIGLWESMQCKPLGTLQSKVFNRGSEHINFRCRVIWDDGKAELQSYNQLEISLQENGWVNPIMPARLLNLSTNSEPNNGSHIYAFKINGDCARRKKEPAFEAQGPEKGSLYVGVTGKKPEERFQQHLRGEKAGKGYVRDCHISHEYSICAQTDLFFRMKKNLDNKDAIKLESWLGWKLSGCGYAVWGPHAHKDEDFLGTEGWE